MMPFERWLNVITMRVRSLFRSRALDDDLNEELQWHVEHLIEANLERGFHTRLLGTFAVLALILAAVGVYGVLAYSVAQRTHEIGVRMALGARATAVVWMVLRGTLWMSAAGVVLGSAGAFAATGLLTLFLFETTPTDLTTFAAGAIPARRATRIDPLVALRHE